MILISFHQGTLELTGTPEVLAPVAELVRWDGRTLCFRAEARRYGPLLLTLHRLGIPFQDRARAFQRRSFTPRDDHRPRPHQLEAIQAWAKAEGRGVVVLPTGAGKTLVARLAMVHAQRDTLVLVPTIDLLTQWHTQLQAIFGPPVGILGGGEHQVEPITVSTYDSALIHMERLGNRFGLLICDECHHLPAPTTRLVAVESIAPFRLGLTATPEREDGAHAELESLIGPICYRTEITDLEGSYLAPYRLEHLAIHLDPDEQDAYQAAYAHYRGFARDNGISFRSASGWQQFLQVCARTREGREAFAAYRTQKRIARASRAKLRRLWAVLRRHAGERVLIFTDDNATAYTIGETFFLPVLTHKTRVTERRSLLEAFRKGEIPVLVTSRVLNEGVDVPEVGVGVVVSGTGSVREHVQRLGRLLRPQAGKEAILYEMVSEDTAETFTSQRRRRHQAYQREPSLL